MKLSEVLKLLEYDRWAADRTLEAVSAVPVEKYLEDRKSSHGGIHGTLVHIYSANTVWYSRWTGTSVTAHIDANEIPDLQTLKSLWTTSQDELDRLLRTLDEAKVNAPFSYKDLRGNPHAEPMFQQVQHLVNHASYHRGQVITMLRQAGATPVATDLIAFYRTT